jgi:MFS family permease
VRTLYFLIFITLLNHCVFAGMRVSVSLYAIHLHATPFTVGVLMALYALLPMLSAISMGRLIDRIGARVPMLIGSVAIALARWSPTCGRR